MWNDGREALRQPEALVEAARATIALQNQTAACVRLPAIARPAVDVAHEVRVVAERDGAVGGQQPSLLLLNQVAPKSARSINFFALSCVTPTPTKHAAIFIQTACPVQPCRQLLKRSVRFIHPTMEQCPPALYPSVCIHRAHMISRHLFISPASFR